MRARWEEGDTTERQKAEGDEDRDFGDMLWARGAPAFSDEHEMDIIEFVKDNPELYAKEHVH